MNVSADSLTETAPQAAAPHAAPRRLPEAMLYLPSIALPKDGAALVARHLADSFSDQAKTRYIVVSGAAETAPAAVAAQPPLGLGRVFSVQPADSEAGIAIDVYEVGYAPRVLARYERMSILEKALRVAMESGWLATSLISSAFVVYRKTFWQRIQLIVVAAALVSLLVYFGLLIGLAEAAFAKAVGVPESSFLGQLYRLHNLTVEHWHAPRLPSVTHAQSVLVDRWAWIAVAVVVAVTLLRHVYGLPSAGPLRHAWHASAGPLANLLSSLRLRTGLMRFWMLPFGFGIVFLALDTAHNCAPPGTGGTCLAKNIVGFFGPVAPLGNLAAYRALQALYRATAWIAAHAAYVAAAITAIGLSRKSLATGFDKAITLVLAIVEYARIGYARSDATGLFLDALTSVAKMTADGKRKYACVHVAGYSAGALVALDALFYTRGIRQDRLDAIGDLITIGPPISLATQLVPGHFSTIVNRFSHPEKHQWINVCSPLDIFGSPILDVPFLPDDLPALDGSSTWARRLRASIRRQRAEAAKHSGNPNNIRFGRKVNVDFTGWYPLDLNTAEVLSLAALQAHEFYWSDTPGPQYTAFTRIAPLLAEGRSFRKPVHDDECWPRVHIATPHLRDGDAVPTCTACFPSSPWVLVRPEDAEWKKNGTPSDAFRTLMTLDLAYDATKIPTSRALTTRHSILIPPDVVRQRRDTDERFRTQGMQLTERGWPCIEIWTRKYEAERSVELELWRSRGLCPGHRSAPILHYHRFELLAVAAGEASEKRVLGTFTIECEVDECVPAIRGQRNGAHTGDANGMTQASLDHSALER